MPEAKEKRLPKPPEPETPSKPEDGYVKSEPASGVPSGCQPSAGAAAAEKAPTEAGPETGEPVPTTASVKFMITIQEEQKLRELGYSQDQINKLKPEEAAEILRCSTPPDPDSQP